VFYVSCNNIHVRWPQMWDATPPPPAHDSQLVQIMLQQAATVTVKRGWLVRASAREAFIFL
jgi:hypothetical protein